MERAPHEARLGETESPVLGDLEPVERETTASIIADRVRDRIIDGTFEPGQQLGEVQLASQLHVSRGPVREAMQRLIQEGLLRNERNRGVFVVELDEDDIRDVYLARSAVEHAAALVIARSGNESTVAELDRLLDEMAGAVREGKWAAVADCDLRFHEALVAASGSRRLARMFRTLLSETRMCLTPLEAAYPRRQDVVEEHRALLEAIREGDAADLVRHLDAHFAHAVSKLSASSEAPVGE